MDRFELLSAVYSRDANEEPPYRTIAAIAARLGVEEAEAGRLLREAEREGLVVEEYDESRNVPADFNRQAWFLTPVGRAELYRLEDERREEERRAVEERYAERERRRAGGGTRS